jgi:amino acid adenylation domain-containing protein
VDFPVQQASLVSRIAAQVSSSPQALAVSAPDARILYKDLAKFSDKLAYRLCCHGVGSGSRVAICLPRSAAMIVSALAVFKAGGAYVSLDPSHPAQRLMFALKDSNAAVLLTGIPTASRLREAGCEVLTIHPALEFADPEEVLPASAENSPDSAAYVIYTSGSTGQQKGVEITHAGLLNLVQWHISQFRVVASDRATQIASPAFDAAVWEIWPYLAAGASLHIPADHIRNSPEAFRDYLADENINIAFAPTVLAERMITLPWPPETSLRTMLTGGDALHHYPPSNLPFDLVNNYGPTEATVVTTSAIVSAADADTHLPTIGPPIDNCLVHILDEQLRPVAAGGEGEICIGGVNVARGYLNRPELTQESFVPDPFSCNPGARLYRSGDRGRALPNGEILFLGRMDEQIKIRGYRIETQEIVSALNSHPSVSDSIVTLGIDASREPCMVAYVVLSNSALTRSGLVEFLAQTLPPFMIPAVFVRLESLPATDNGKVDRASLPLPASNNMLLERAPSAPANALEETIAAIVRSLLGIQQIGVDENFFLLGGHSLLGTQVIGKMRDSFGVELPLRALFEHPTIAELSSEVEKLLLQKAAE